MTMKLGKVEEKTKILGKVPKEVIELFHNHGYFMYYTREGAAFRCSKKSGVRFIFRPTGRVLWKVYRQVRLPHKMFGGLWAIEAESWGLYFLNMQIEEVK